MSTGKTKPTTIEFTAVLREIAPGQVVPHLLVGEREQMAPSYGYIIPAELQIDGQWVIMRKHNKGMRKGVDWEVIPLDNPPI